jgi:phosphoglycolate phosphatase
MKAAQRMAKPLKLVIFDCDGTLVDSQHMIVAAMRQAYAALGLVAPGRERLLSIVGLSLEEAFLDLGEGAVDFPVRGLVEHYKIAFSALRRSSAAHEPLFPGAREAIECLSGRDDVRLGVATGKSRRGVAIVLGRHGLLDRFATIQTADDAPSKPHPGMAMAAMREAGVAPADTIVVGDTTFDMGMAGAAGAAGIGVAWGYHPPSALRDAGARTVVADFSVLLPALDLIWNERERREVRVAQ